MEIILELLAPAGSPEGVSAVIESGADSVYMSFGSVSGVVAGQLTEDEFGRAAEFCRVRGAKIYYSADLAPFDEEFMAALENARRAVRMGADAIIANDIGLIWALRQAVPSMPVHAGPKLGVHSVEGVRLLAAMGVRRACLSPMLSADEIREICRASLLEVEVTVHGPLCPAFPGQCALGAFSGEGSAMRQVCSRACLNKFPAGSKGRHPFGTKDLCLIDKLGELERFGVTAVRIGGRARRPEYAAAVTGVYSKVIKTGLAPNEDDMSLLKRAFPAAGFTQGFYAQEDSLDMAGVPGQESREDSPFYYNMRKDYLNHEFQRVPVDFTCSLQLHEPLRVTAADDRGNRVQGEGEEPELAFHVQSDTAYMRTELSRTGGTPFYLNSLKCEAGKGLYISTQSIGEVRDRLLQELMEKRVYIEPKAEEAFEQPPAAVNSTEPPVLTVWISRRDQLSQELLELAPQVLYAPLSLVTERPDDFAPYMDKEGMSICPALPRVVKDSDMPAVTELLRRARQFGVSQVLAGSLDQVLPLLRLGFSVRGDWSMNIRNSASLYALRGLRLKSAAVSPEMSAARTRAISKTVDTELIVYGRIPLMYMGVCPMKNSTGACSCDRFGGLTDSDGFQYPVLREWGCRSTVYSPRKLFLAGRSREYMSAGLWGVRLMFTTENAQECAAITRRYLELGTYEPGGVTTGMF